MRRLKKLEALTLTEQLKLAASSLTDPRTVAKFLRGEKVRTLSAERIRVAAVNLGYVLPKAPEAR